MPRRRSDLSEDATRRRVQCEHHLFNPNTRSGTNFLSSVAREVPNPKATTTPAHPPHRTTVTVTSTEVLNAPTLPPIKVVNPKYPNNPKFQTTYIAKPVYTQTTTHPGEPRTRTTTVVVSESRVPLSSLTSCTDYFGVSSASTWGVRVR